MVNKYSPHTPLDERFWDRVFKTDTCWIWQGTKDAHGYGIIMVDGIRQRATRIAYKLTYGEFDESMGMCHHCDHPSCVRPDHLFPGTQKHNMEDCSKKKRTNSKKISKPFRCLTPDGKIIEGNNLRQFCIDNGLHQGCMWHVLFGTSKQGHHRGFRKAT